MNRPVDIAGLVFFRIAFGAILLWETVRYFHKGWIHESFVAPSFHFTYHGFGWVQPWPGVGMHLHFIALGALAAMIAAGAYYRLATVLFFLGFTYLFLLDKAAYLNHLYLVCCLSFLLIFLPAERSLSWDAWRVPSRRADFVPAWCLWVLRAQIAIVYFYGGIAKLNGDWLQGQPMQIWLSQMSHLRALLPIVGEERLALLFSYGGFLFDLLVTPFLLWRPTRTAAFVAAVLFHLFNAATFEIGIFPWFMICATTLFFAPDWPRKWPGKLGVRFVQRPISTPGEQVAGEGSSPTRRFARYGLVGVLTLYFAAQLLLPLRHLLYPGDVDWTEEGARFAWRMMLNEKAAAIQIVLVDSHSGRRTPLDPRAFLTPRQIDKMGHDPEMMREFASFVKEELAQAGMGRFEVRVLALCSLNGRKPQLLIDPSVDLGSEPRTLLPKPWIVPLVEPLPEQPWVVPPSEWPKYVETNRPPP